jgi:hypothetical protein
VPNAHRVASGEESDGYNDDDDARSADSLDDPKLVPLQVNNMHVFPEEAGTR